ncbi:MAG: hypothetical protein M3046_04895 [Actinomycetota bacterium]|nr:hypothetical protein [Actinomycetota bacterium]
MYAEFEGLALQIDLAEEFEQQSRAASGVPSPIEPRENAPYLVEGSSVASMVGAGLAERHSAAREHLADHFGAVADRVVLLRGSDVEDLVLHPFPRRVDRPQARVRDVERVYERTPWGSSLLRRIFTRRQRESHKVVQHDVESHPRQGSEGRRVAKEGG